MTRIGRSHEIRELRCRGVRTAETNDGINIESKPARSPKSSAMNIRSTVTTKASQLPNSEDPVQPAPDSQRIESSWYHGTRFRPCGDKNSDADLHREEHRPTGSASSGRAKM